MRGVAVLQKGAAGKKKKADRGGRGHAAASKQPLQQQVPGLDLESTRVELQQVSQNIGCFTGPAVTTGVPVSTAPEALGFRAVTNEPCQSQLLRLSSSVKEPSVSAVLWQAPSAPS